MLATTLILALIALSMAEDPYAKKETEAPAKEEEKAVAGPEYYDEVFAIDEEGQVYAVTTLNQEGAAPDWKKSELVQTEYKGSGVAICNEAKDDYGRWKYLYVADAGDENFDGSVTRYDVVRDADKPGEIAVDKKSAKVVYGTGKAVAEMEDVAAKVAPQNIVCDTSAKGILIADANQGAVAWKSEKAEVADPYVKVDEAAEVADPCASLKDVRGIAVDENNVLWTAASQGDNADDVNAVWRVGNGKEDVQCDEAKNWGAQSGDAVWGVAYHNDKVLFTTGKGNVWEKDSSDAWASGYDEAGAVKSAGDRGVLVADGKDIYISQGKDKGNKIAKADADVYQVDFYAGQKWEADSASAVVVAASALVAAVAAQL